MNLSLDWMQCLIFCIQVLFSISVGNESADIDLDCLMVDSGTMKIKRFVPSDMLVIENVDALACVCEKEKTSDKEDIKFLGVSGTDLFQSECGALRYFAKVFCVLAFSFECTLFS